MFTVDVKQQINNNIIVSVCKIFTNILCIRLTKWNEQNNIIDESQAGVRKGYSTVYNIFIFQAFIQKYLSKKTWPILWYIRKNFFTRLSKAFKIFNYGTHW